MYSELEMVVSRYLGIGLIGHLVSSVASILGCIGDYLSDASELV